MGLPPAQGHNNLRLNTNANLYQNHNIRLDTRQYNTTFRTHQTQHYVPHSTTYHRREQCMQPTTKPKKQVRISLPSSILKSTASRNIQFDRERNLALRLSTPNYSQSTSASASAYSRSANVNRISQSIQSQSQIQLKRPKLRSPRKKSAIVSNLPLINVNSSIVMVNHSPFGLRDPRFGILHHCSQSVSYF